VGPPYQQKGEGPWRTISIRCPGEPWAEMMPGLEEMPRPFFLSFFLFPDFYFFQNFFKTTPNESEYISKISKFKTGFLK
jgi:hypothetical protein